MDNKRRNICLVSVILLSFISCTAPEETASIPITAGGYEIEIVSAEVTNEYESEMGVWTSNEEDMEMGVITYTVRWVGGGEQTPWEPLDFILYDEEGNEYGHDTVMDFSDVDEPDKRGVMFNVKKGSKLKELVIVDDVTFDLAGK